MGQTYQYDTEGRVTSATGTLGSGNYVYTNEAQRVLRTASGTTHLYARESNGGPVLAEYTVVGGVARADLGV